MRELYNVAFHLLSEIKSEIGSKDKCEFCEI